MAKKGNRVVIYFECSVCGRKNYTSRKNNNNTKDKLTLNKFCPKCVKHTEHKEIKK